jgi:tetratricopeptide (TPR) repeat protein
VRIVVLFICILFASFALCRDEHHHVLTQEEVGSVHFSTSCSKTIESSFNRSVALLHSFQYEQARQSFDEISNQDPKCAMAQWGIAMSHYHGLWDNGDTALGRSAIHRAEQIAAANPKTTAREIAYVDALAEIYREDDQDGFSHGQAYEKKMNALESAYPTDSEAAIFHALSLAITAPKTDKTFANQRRCGEILQPIFEKQPHHPGVAHYLIHCYDNPVLAERGLSAARTYAKIAPASAHANHMPSHIFTRVGSWDESVSSNLKSAGLAAKAEESSINGEARDQRLHALDYLEYAYLQSGRIKQAKGVLYQVSALQPVAGLTLTGDYALAAIPARYAIELENWDQASALKIREDAVPWAQAITWAAIGVGSARSGNLDRASQAERKLASLRDMVAKQNNIYWSNQVEVQRREVAAWIAEKTGKDTDAIALIRSAAELEESMDKHAVTPGAVTPAREMLAQLLFSEGQPQQSLAEYEAALKLAPNRFNALYGAACAAEASGNPSAANRYFQKLTEISVGEERQELVTARKKVALTANSGGNRHP